MWRNYVTVGLRGLTKNRTYAIINVFGLAIGLAACLTILLYVRHEISYDSWLAGSERTYQLQTSVEDAETGQPQGWQLSAYAAAKAVRKDFPQIERLVWALPEEPVLMREGNATALKDALLVDGAFFEVLPFPLVRGDAPTALSAPGDVVLTESEAARLFGNADPIGRTLTLVIWGKPVEHRVTGIAADPPQNSHTKFSLVARFDPETFFADSPDILTNWGWLSGYVYARLKPGVDAAALNAAFSAWEKRNIPDQNADGARTNYGDDADWSLVNIGDVHLGAAQTGAMKPGNDRGTIVTFAIVALMILVIACVNFVNLTTARATQRAREVALRKVLGARRKQLIAQFLGEATVVAAVAMLIALALVELTLPVVGEYLGARLTLPYFGPGALTPAIVGIVLAVGLLGGLYPAFYLSRFKPALILKANQSASGPDGSSWIRSALVLAQFAVSIGLMICTAIIYWQTVFARETDPGYQREGILQISRMGSGEIRPVRDALLNEIRSLDGVTAVGRTSIGVATKSSINTKVHLAGRTEPVEIGNYPVDPGFIPAMGIKILAGRNFDANRPMDDASLPYPSKPEVEGEIARRGVNVVVNELAARTLGFADPAEALGKQVRVALVEPQHGLVPATIVGVVENSRFRSVREPIEPMLFRNSRFEHQYLVVRYRDADPAAVSARVGGVWKRLVPEVPFEAEFSEDIVGGLYEAEEARGQAFAAFTGLAIVIACLGLFGLAAFTAERRTKEIGIRKVFGARAADIVKLLAWQFSKPVIVANLIAWPAAWWVMRDWLNGFDARIDLGPGPFVVAGLVALAIAIGTIAGHAIKVARSNPIHALRYE